RATSNRNGGRDHLGILGEIKSVHPGEIIGIRSLIECELAEHPAILLQPEWYAHVRKVQDELYVLYPEIAVTQS
ncbi:MULTISPECIES: hypothetical protein, partial [unclassified Bradyrhizobium]|uniref:hypothetical protein n=1 Tax=unclassified Bradyrhizobium TaxID=2631580 RepID=UPI0033951B61